MIRIEELRKIYEAKKDTPCVALDGVSFVLPEKGMVFVVGKSGSGKSTLLNLLGGLDSVTDGDIIVGGKRFSEFSEADYDDYRNSFVGFVFQDFCLLEGLTVHENVRLSLDLLGEVTDEQVNDVLRTVELEEYANRFPKELSGGQKQRIALARALVKSPRLILADEPTGNLDQKTARQVLDSLKALSHDRLVVIVSHNIEDAERYADRIIELADGKITRDVSKNEASNTPLINGKTITLPIKRKLTKEELSDINEAVKQDDVKITQVDDDFIPTPTDANTDVGEYTPIKKKIPLKKQLYISSKLLKGNRLQSIFTVILVSAMIILLSVCRIFAKFDGKQLIKDSVNDSLYPSFSLHKGYYRDAEKTDFENGRLVEVTDKDIQAFYDAGYSGNVYKLYNVTLAISHFGWNTLEQGKQIKYSDSASLYISLASGVLECDKEFLDEIYGINGSIEVLAGDINESTPRAVIITDYFADCIMQHDVTYKSYQSIIDSESIGQTGFDVKAIVKTGYAEKYSSLISEYKKITKNQPQRKLYSALRKLKEHEEFAPFFNEVKNYLSLAYYFGDDFESQDIAYVQARGGTSLDNPCVILNGEQYSGDHWSYSADESLQNGEIKIPIKIYNSIMHTRLSEEEAALIPQFEITLVDYPFYSNEVEPVYTKTFTVTAVVPDETIMLSYADYLELYQVHLYPYAICFDNTKSAAGIFTDMESSDFFTNNEFFKTIYKIMDVVEVFKDFFLLLYLGLIAVCALLYINFARRSIKRRLYEIGVLRALGSKNETISQLFTYNLLVMAVFISIISIGGFLISIPLLNDLLIENLAIMLNTGPIKALKILHFDLLSSLIDVITILLLSFLSSFSVLMSCKKIKPINIIRNKD